MAHYTEFNNNNYLPWMMYNDSSAVASPPYAATAQFRTPGVPQNGFTFTSPTQVNTLATYRPSIQTTSPINSLGAPGVGTSWQHSIPVTMPWVDVKGTMHSRGTGPATIFTGISHSVYANPQLSHSISARAPKRKAVEFAEEAPLSKVYLCADQFANMMISPREQQNSGATGVQYYAGAQGKGDAEGWQRFREVESRLDLEVGENTDLNMDLNNSTEGGPRLKVADGVLKPVCNSSPILPRKVMEDITKPCMQIVLWKSPAEHIQEVSKEGNHTTASSTTASTSSIVDTKSCDGQKTGTSPASTSQDYTMEMSSDTSTSGSFSNPSQHSHHPPSIYGMSQTIVTSPSSSQKVMLSATGPRNGMNTSEDNSILCNTDVSDSMDDDMQL